MTGQIFFYKSVKIYVSVKTKGSPSSLQMTLKEQLWYDKSLCGAISVDT